MSAVHINDRIYAMERAIDALVAVGESRNVISDMRTMLDELRREVRGQPMTPNERARAMRDALEEAARILRDIAELAQRGDAVAWMHATSGDVLTHHPQEYGRAHEEWVPLYAAPKPPSAPVGVERIEAVLYQVYMDHPDSSLTTTMIHDMAAAVVQSIAQQPASPDGMVLVPREPTQAMLYALAREWDSVGRRSMEENYAAMLAASAKPQEVDRG